MSASRSVDTLCSPTDKVQGSRGVDEKTELSHLTWMIMNETKGNVIHLHLQSSVYTQGLLLVKKHLLCVCEVYVEIITKGCLSCNCLDKVFKMSEA